MFAERIKELRTQERLTQREFCERVGISTTTLVSYEKGGKTPSYDILVKIANTFGASLDWLCEVEKAVQGDTPRTFADVLRVFAGLSRAWNWGDKVSVEREKVKDYKWGGKETYREATVIKLFSGLCCDFDTSTIEGCHDEDDFYFDPHLDEINSGYFSYDFNNTVEELSKMVRLVHDGTIDEDLFDLWLERKCDEYSNRDALFRRILTPIEIDGDSNADDQ